MSFVILGGEGFLGRADPYKNTIEEFLFDNGFGLSENDGTVRPMPSQKEHFDRVFRMLHQQKENFSCMSGNFSEEKFYSYLDYLHDPKQKVDLDGSNHNHVSQFPLGISRYYYELNKKKNATYLCTEVSLPDEYKQFSSRNEVYMGILDIKGLNQNSRNLFYKELKDRLNNRIPRNKIDF